MKLIQLFVAAHWCNYTFTGADTLKNSVPEEHKTDLVLTPGSQGGAYTRMLDVARLREDTPGCSGNLIHFNNAGASLKPRPVVEAVATHLEMEERLGGYEAAEDAAQSIDGFYSSVAALINGQTDEVAYLDSATRAWHTAFHAIDWQAGDEVLASTSEYNSNMISFRHAENRFGICVKLVPESADGCLDCVALEQMINARTKLICLSHIPTNDSMVHPAAAVGKIAQAHGVPFLLDACQSVGQMPIDVTEIGCTMLTATGRKYLRGPRGSGFLWVDRSWQDRLVPATLDIRSARWVDVDRFEVTPGAARYELWENSVAAQIGLGTAARYASSVSLEAIWGRIQVISEQLRALIAEMPGFTVHDRGDVKSGIVTFSSKDMRSDEITARLRSEFSINTSVSATQLTRSDLVSQGVTHMVRASVHAFNTEDELEALARALSKLTGCVGQTSALGGHAS